MVGLFLLLLFYTILAKRLRSDLAHTYSYVHNASQIDHGNPPQLSYLHLSPIYAMGMHAHNQVFYTGIYECYWF